MFWMPVPLAPLRTGLEGTVQHLAIGQIRRAEVRSGSRALCPALPTWTRIAAGSEVQSRKEGAVFLLLSEAAEPARPPRLQRGPCSHEFKSLGRASSKQTDISPETFTGCLLTAVVKF